MTDLFSDSFSPIIKYILCFIDKIKKTVKVCVLFLLIKIYTGFQYQYFDLTLMESEINLDIKNTSKSFVSLSLVTSEVIISH